MTRRRIGAVALACLFASAAFGRGDVATQPIDTGALPEAGDDRL